MILIFDNLTKYNTKSIFFIGLLLSVFPSVDLFAGTDPTADFSVDNATPVIGESIQFTDLSSDDATNWSWDFGDSNSSTSQHPSHSYVSVGVYTIELTARGSGLWSDTNTKTDYITVYGTYPVTSFTVANMSGTSADLSWQTNANGEDVVIAVVPDNFTGQPIDGNSYIVGDVIPGGGTVIYVGDDTAVPFTYNNFVPGETNYVCIWSVNNNKFYSNAVKEDFLISNGWQGVDNDWFNTNNWVSGEVPTLTDDAYIPESPLSGNNFPIINSSQVIEVNNLEIDNNAFFTIEPGARVSIDGDLICASTNQFVVKNSTEYPSSVIIKGNVNEAIQLDWTYTESIRYWYIGLAINGASVINYGDPQVDVFMHKYNNAWQDISMSGTLDAKLEGYSVIFKNDNTIASTSGTINQGELTRSLSSGWNLLGNPYLSYIDLNEATGWDFDNSIEQTVWIRTDVVGNRGFATYNISEGVGANGGSNEIAPGQSFWLNVTADADFKINEAAQIHGTNSGGEGGLKSTSINEREEVFRFSIGNGIYSDEMVAVFMPYGSTLLTSRDSKKRLVSNADFPQIYAIKSSTQVVINIASSLSNEQSMPLGINIPESKSYVFKANSLTTFLPTYDISLEDKLLGEYYDLRINPELEIEMEEGTSDDRFVLHFAQRSTDLEEPVIAKKPFIYAANGMAYINIDSDQYNNRTGDCTVEVYDFAGKKHIIQDLHTAQTQIELPESNKLWIIVVRIGNKSYHEKVSSFE